MAKPAKSSRPVDKHVGNRVRMRRIMLDMSQTALGEAAGVSFQQVQKYESGMNRIGASRLLQIAHTLQVPAAFFFDGHAHQGKVVNDQPLDDLTNFMATREGIALARSFIQISIVQLRRRIVDLIEQIEENRN